MKNELFLIVNIVFINFANCQTNISIPSLSGKWFEYSYFFINNKDSLIDKSYLKSSYLKEIFQQGNSMGNIKYCEESFLNDSIIVGKLYYLSGAKPSTDTMKYKFVDKKTLEMRFKHENEIKTKKVHILYSSKKYLILGDENDDMITLYEKQDNNEIDNNLRIKDEYFIIPFVEEYINILKLNIKIK